MKDVKGFCRLFDINVPSYDEIDYYLDILSKTNKYKNIKELASLFEKNEEEFGDLFQARVEKSKKLIDFLTISHAYTEMTYDQIPDLPTNKEFKPDEDKKYLSIDLTQANWQALKKYDEFNGLGNSYSDFLRKFDFPEIFIHSKFLRQFIYGNLNPKKQQKIQRHMIQTDVIDVIGDKIQIAWVKNDEVVYSYNNLSEIIPIVESLNLDKFHYKIFSTKFVEDFRINSYINKEGEFLYKEIVGGDGLKFYMNLKRYILEEPLDIRDLYFHVNGETAIWKTDKLKIELV